MQGFTFGGSAGRNRLSRAPSQNSKSTIKKLIRVHPVRGPYPPGVSVYFFPWKNPARRKPTNLRKTARKQRLRSPWARRLSPSLAARRSPTAPGDSSIYLEKQNGVWQITEPIETGADPMAIPSQSLFRKHWLSTHRGTMASGAPHRQKVYGLDPVPISISTKIKLQNGAQHTLRLGNKDLRNIFGLRNCGRRENMCALLPVSLRTEIDLPIFGEDFAWPRCPPLKKNLLLRFLCRLRIGEIEAKKRKTGWTFTKPAPEKRVDDTGATSLRNAVANGKMSAITSRVR